MKAICEDGLVIDCAGYKAIDSGVVLTADEDRDHVIAFVPNERLAYLLPDDLAERERERLGLSAPVVTSPEDLESRLEEFGDELDDLRGHLGHLVEDLVEGEDLDEENLDRHDELHERRGDVDDLLQQVRQRSQQMRHLSSTGAETDGEAESSAEPERDRTEDAADGDVEALRTEMDDRFDRIERQLREFARTVEGAGTEPEDGDGDDSGTERSEGDDEAAAESAAADLERIDGLGSTYRGRLVDAGIETLDDLAGRDPEVVAEAANASQSRAASWVERAGELLEERERERDEDGTDGEDDEDESSE